MALSRKIKVKPRKFQKQKGGLVQYGFGGTLGSIGATASAIPTPWTQIGGGALSLIGGIVSAQEEQKAALQEKSNAFMAKDKVNQASITNQYRPTFPFGGRVGKKTNNEVTGSPDSTTWTSWVPQTKTNAYFGLSKANALNGMSRQDWDKLTPDQTTQYLGEDKGWDYTSDNNDFKYWQKTEVPGTPKYNKQRSAISNEYLKAKSRTFPFGGIVPGMQPNIEVEGGEVIQGADKSMAKVNGPKHSKGGVPLMMANGGRVFSDRIINPETGRTFAEDAEVLMKKIR